MHIRLRLDIPVAVVHYPPELFDRWKAAQEPWRESGYRRWSVWGPHARNRQRGRISLPVGVQASCKFPEFHTAHLLERRGFTCWSGVQLFAYGQAPRDASLRMRNTAVVKDLWAEFGWRWPADIQHTITAHREWPVGKKYPPRNPDIVAYHERRREWRFYEVKGWPDRTNPEQLTALAAIYLMTGAPVGIVRLVPSGHHPKPSKWLHACPAEIRLKQRADHSWIQCAAARLPQPWPVLVS